MVQAENGTMTFRGASGRSYSVSIYISDVAAAPITWSMDGLAVAGSDTFWVAPEDVILSDVSITTGNAVVSVLKMLINNTPTGQIISIANSINTLANRVSPMLGIRAGRKVQFLQA